MILYTQTNYAFKCALCNSKYYVYKEHYPQECGSHICTCENFINLSIEEIPCQLKDLFSKPCEFLIFMYTIKRKLSKEPFIDPFEFTYFYIKELSKITGFNMTLDYSDFYEPHEDDFFIFKEFLDHFDHINSLKSIE
jgi:hypothetical protein